MSAAELAEVSGIGHRTIQRFEASNNVPDSRTGILRQLISALEARGIEFLGDPVTSPGVQLKTKAQRR